MPACRLSASLLGPAAGYLRPERIVHLLWAWMRILPYEVRSLPPLPPAAALWRRGSGEEALAAGGKYLSVGGAEVPYCVIREALAAGGKYLSEGDLTSYTLPARRPPRRLYIGVRQCRSMHMSGNTRGHRHAVPVTTIAAALPPTPPVQHTPPSSAVATVVSWNELPPTPPVQHLPAPRCAAVPLLGTTCILPHDTGRGA